MVKVIGYRLMEGEFTNDKKESIKFDNICLHTITDENPNVKGFAVQDPIKIKRGKLYDVLRGGLNLENIIDREIVISYYLSGNKPILNGIFPVNES